MKNYRDYLPAMLKDRPTAQLVGGAVVLAILLVLGARFVFAGKSSTATDTTDSAIPAVQVASVAALASQAGPLQVIGTVKSENQATILSQTAGELVSLNRSIGDRVVAGSVIGQFENSSQRAAVLQAQGAYDAAQATLAKVTGTGATNASLSSDQAATASANAAASLNVSLTSLYAAIDDAVHAKADALFSNLDTPTPRFAPLTVPDSQLIIDIENGRLALTSTITDASAQSIGNGPVDDRARAMLADANTVVALLGKIITALNIAVPNNNYSAAQIASYQASLGAARSAVVGSIAAVTSGKAGYDAALSGSKTASNLASSGTASDIAAAQAGTKSAQGALAAAQAALEKTIVRSPISGTIVSLPVTRGDYVPMFAQVAIVSNPGALYVDAQITSDDAKDIAPGNAVTIAGSIPGTVTFVAPALDPSTGKIEVKVGITRTAGLTDGESVTLALARTGMALKKSANAPLAIPIAAIKVSPAGPIVFSVSASSTLAAMPVTLGSILGDRIVVSGIDPTTEIITDARGHTEGEQVEVLAASAR